MNYFNLNYIDMPNWFYFTLEVSGKKKDVESFMDNVQGSEKYESEEQKFDFNHFIPQPENVFRGNLGVEERKRCAENNIPNWYDWNTHNWGTKWNAVVDDRVCEYSVSGKNHSLVYRMRTAWAFPSDVIEKMLEMYPHLSFEIEGEEETGSYGIYVKHDNGNTISWHEEDPTLIDEYTDKEVYYDSASHVYRYTENNEVVGAEDEFSHDSHDFYPITKYSWS
jgi:hypothetical protein